jgi:hypothetical protein
MVLLDYGPFAKRISLSESWSKDFVFTRLASSMFAILGRWYFWRVASEILGIGSAPN